MNWRIGFLCCLSSAAIASAAVYECPGVGYTQTPNSKNCKAVDLGKPNIYTPAPITRVPALSTAPSDTINSPSAAGNNNAVANNATAQQNLEAARKALEEGKKVRYGNERNYARYQERIKGLEENVRRAEAAAQSEMRN